MAVAITGATASVVGTLNVMQATTAASDFRFVILRVVQGILSIFGIRLQPRNKIFGKVSGILFWSGFVLSTLSFFFASSLLNTFIFFIYIFLAIFILFVALKRKK